MENIARLVKFPFSKTEEILVKTALLHNKVLAFPTETFYGLGGNAFLKKVADRVYNIKERPRNKPLLVLTTPEWLPGLCLWNDSRIDDLMNAFWPGPLTLILAANPELPQHLQNSDGTLAVRYTSAPAAQCLIELGSCPIIGTSANLTGMPECSSATEVHNQLNNKVDMIIDGGELEENRASTILNCQNKNFEVLRHGVIPSAEINRICEVS
jgi:L-threonylcarbamoyladenylate synthase